MLKPERFVSGCCGESPVTWSTATSVLLDLQEQQFCFLILHRLYYADDVIAKQIYLSLLSLSLSRDLS